MNPGKIYWITGLSGAGKTTLCRSLVELLRSQQEPVIMLDGDELRDTLGVAGSYSREDRMALARTYAKLCRLIAGQGTNVAIATIAMFREAQQWNRANLPGYHEIYLDVPLEELKRRDPKKIYSRFAKGEIKHVAGLDFAVDAPLTPDVHVKWSPAADSTAVLAQVWQGLGRGALPLLSFPSLLAESAA